MSRGEDCDKCCQLVGFGRTAYDRQEAVCAEDLSAAFVTHSGMFPCFLGGRLARLLRSMLSARIT